MAAELLSIKNTTKCPPNGWRYEELGTGFKAMALNLPDLIRKIEAYWEANNIPKLDNWRELLEDEICRFNEIEDTHCGQPDKPRKIESDRKLQPHDLLGFLKTVKQWAAKGFTFVEVDEAERRAEICATCPMNVVVDGCHGCSGILSYVRGQLNRRANHRGLVARVTSQDDSLNNCEVCGCVLEVKVHLPMEVATYVKPPDDRKYPEHCWMIDNNET